MSEDPHADSPPLGLDGVARAAAELAAQADLAGALSGFLDLVRAWAAPSAVVAVVRDADAESGWRLLPALCAGSVPVGTDRAVARLVTETPGCLARPTVVRGEEISGVRVRDNVTVPWWSEGTSGLLLLRGVPRPFPANLGDALSLTAASIWPRLLGSPAERLEALVRELRSASARLDAEATRHLDRLQAQGRAAAPPEPPEGGSERVAALEQALAAAEAERDAKASEARELGARADALQAEQTAARDGRARAEEAEAAATARVQELERALAAAEAERDARASEARELAARADTHEAERTAARDGRARAEEAIAAATARAEELERALASAVASREADGSRARELTSRLEDLQRELAASAEERRRADQSLAEARDHLEERRRFAEAAESRANRADDELRTALRELALARARGGRTEETGDVLVRLKEARAAAGAAEARAGEMSSRWEKATAALGGALVALRRAAFVPPTLRVSLEDASGLVEGSGRPARRLGIAVLDRDAVGLEALAGELEAAGIDVRIASQPEEVALLLRTPEAGAMDAVVLDVISFRPEQNVAGLIRSWDKDRPGLAFYLSYDAQSPAEVERARRVPMSLTAGHLPRPLAITRLTETIETLARRQGKA